MNMVQTLAVGEDEGDIRLDRWFHRHFPDVTHGALEKLLRSGQVRVEGRRAKSNQRLEPGQNIRIPPLNQPPREAAPASKPVSERDAEALRAAILFMDDDVIVLNKPPGLAVQGGSGQAMHLDLMLGTLQFDSSERPRLVHRLDKDTSGVLVLGRNVGATSKLAAHFASRQTRKCYWALVMGVPKLHKGRIDAPLAKLPGRLGERMEVNEKDGLRAVTWYRVVDSIRRTAAWLELEPRTGRTHQLRAHCALIGTPIVGDGKYGGKEAVLSGPGLSRKLHLHARAIRIPHPRSHSGRDMIEVTAPLPSHIEVSFTTLGLDEHIAGPAFASFEEE